MCELFGMSSRLPTTVRLSLARLARRGRGETGLGDGWGAVFHDGTDIRLFKAPGPAEDDPLVAALAAAPLAAPIVLSHLRHATQGARGLENTQPFARELGGRMHVFAHNGNLRGIQAQQSEAAPRFRPLGATDSEAAFCLLLARLAPLWDGPAPPDPAARAAVVTAFAAALRPLGPANFLYSDGACLFAHGDRRTQSDGRIVPPGLHVLHRACAVDPEALTAAGVGLPEAQEVTLFASVPLTAEPWRPLAPGEVLMARAGALVAI